MKKLYTLIFLHLIIYNLNNAFAQCTNPTLSLNLPDTTIVFKQDSVLLDAGAGFTTYSWNTGATTRFVWAKFNMKYKVTVTSGNNCGSDSTIVLSLNGIQQNDTNICQDAFVVLSPPNYLPTTGLVAYYNFNGNTLDKSNNGHHISTNFNNYKTIDRFSIPENSMRFTNIYDTTSSGVEFPNTLSSSFNNLTNGSISMWVKINQHVISNHYFGFDNMLMVKQKHGVNTQLYLGLLGNTRKLRFHLDGGLPSSYIFSSNTILDTGVWYNVVVTWNGIKHKIFINGVLDNELNSQTVLTNMTSPSYFILGIRDEIGTAASNSDIDEVGFWSRALSNEEINGLFKQTSTNPRFRWSTNDTTNSITVSPNTSTTYYCDITVGSYTFRDSVRINVSDLPNKNVSYTKLGLCKNDTITLSANAGYNYNWFKNDSVVSSLQTLNVAKQGAYRVALTDSFGCKNTSDTLHVFNAPLPSVQFTINDSAQCVNDNLFLFKDSTLIDSGSYNRLWNFGSGNTSTQMEPSFNFSTVGTYPIKLEVSSNYGCKDSLTKTVTVLANPTAGPMLGETNALSVATPYIYTVAQQPNHTYNWVVSNGIIAAGQGTNAATVQWLSNGKGSLKVEVTNVQGCNDTTATQVTIGNVGLNDLNNLKELVVYPNPSNGTFAVSFNALKSSTVEMSLVNLLGQQIWNVQQAIQAGEQVIQINANLSPGVYTLRINGAEEQVQYKVIIK